MPNVCTSTVGSRNFVNGADNISLALGLSTSPNNSQNICQIFGIGFVKSTVFLTCVLFVARLAPRMCAASENGLLVFFIFPFLVE